MFKNTILPSILPALRMLAVMTILTGVIYPVVITLAAGVIFPAQANGSLQTVNGVVVGSSLIAQPFASDKYFQPRPSANNYGIAADGSFAASSGSNQGPTNAALLTAVQERGAAIRTANKLAADAVIPPELVYASASGLDPHISPAAARLQIDRVTAARGLPRDMVAALVEQFVESPQLGVLGEARVNVLMLNIALDQVK